VDSTPLGCGDKWRRIGRINAFVADLITGSGSNLKSPTSNLYTAAERLTPLKTAEDVAQVFFGTRIQCASATTIRSIAGRWTTTTASPASSPA
jgi:hypothetical protein